MAKTIDEMRADLQRWQNARNAMQGQRECTGELKHGVNGSPFEKKKTLISDHTCPPEKAEVIGQVQSEAEGDVIGARLNSDLPKIRLPGDNCLLSAFAAEC